jgi:hypothetical protein
MKNVGYTISENQDREITGLKYRVWCRRQLSKSFETESHVHAAALMTRYRKLCAYFDFVCHRQSSILQEQPNQTLAQKFYCSRQNMLFYTNINFIGNT